MHISTSKLEIFASNWTNANNDVKYIIIVLYHEKVHPSKCINHTAYTHTNLIILLTNFKLVMSYPNYLNYPTFWLFGFWKLYDSAKHQSVFVLLV